VLDDLKKMVTYDESSETKEVWIEDQGPYLGSISRLCGCGRTGHDFEVKLADLKKMVTYDENRPRQGPGTYI